MKLKILIVSMAKGWGGAEEYLENLYERLSKRGIDARILVREGGEYAKRLYPRDNILQIPGSFKGIVQLTRAGLINRGIHIIHVNRYYDICRGWYLKRLIPHSILILYQHCYLNHPHRLSLSLTDGIICVSEFVKSSLTEKFPDFEEVITVIHPGIDTEMFKAKKEKYGINGTTKIAMVGRFDKNQQELIHIAAVLKKRGIPVMIYFAGSGKAGEEKNLRILSETMGIKEQIFFPGKIPHHEMPSFYLSMDSIASTMRNEGFPLAAMEAMACGLPFVAYNASGFSELIDNHKNGILVEGGIKEFADSLESLIKSQEARQRIGKNAVEKAREDFDINRNVDQYVEFMNKCFIKNA